MHIKKVREIPDLYYLGKIKKTILDHYEAFFGAVLSGTSIDFLTETVFLTVTFLGAGSAFLVATVLVAAFFAVAIIS